MVSVVVDHQDSPLLSFDLEPSIGILECGQSLGDLFEGDLELEAGRRGGHGIQDAVQSRYLQANRAETLPVTLQRITRAEVFKLNVGGRHVCLTAEAVGYNAPLDARYDGLHVRIFEAQNGGAIEGYLVGERHKCLLDLREIGVMVQVLSVDVRDHGNSGAQFQKGAVAFVSLGHQKVPFSKPGVAADSIQPPPDDDRGIVARVTEDGRNHRRGGGLPMTSSHCDSVFETHELGQHFRSRDYGDLPLFGFHAFDIVGAHC